VSETKPERLNLTFPSTHESVDEIEAAAEKLAAEAGLDEDERFHVSVAAREAAVNAVLHGNQYDPAKQITASFEITGEALRITISDQVAPENLLRGSGRGIFIMRSFMDEVHFRQLQPGLELTLVKHLAPSTQNS